MEFLERSARANFALLMRGCGVSTRTIFRPESWPFCETLATNRCASATLGSLRPFNAAGSGNAASWHGSSVSRVCSTAQSSAAAATSSGARRTAPHEPVRFERRVLAGDDALRGRGGAPRRWCGRLGDVAVERGVSDVALRP